ncbi:hypothetical protein Ocin01_03632 [Orchesella cincta]|uniref:Uncharacterized protein n=1 Tax=Orchesella cincta TaxID=48709 RepID=A0A1D2NCT0_ORCCI|nr:hypothetical protein Ocin01_03632 [Orchesella cincta]
MQKFTIVILVVASFAAYSSAAVRPQSKLYFSTSLTPPLHPLTLLKRPVTPLQLPPATQQPPPPHKCN